MPPVSGWEFTDDGTDDRSVRTTLEKWAIAKIGAEADVWIAAAAGTPIAFNAVDHYRGAYRPAQNPGLEALFRSGQDPACWVSTWGSSSQQRTELPPDWNLELHCLVGCRIPEAAGARARIGSGEKAGLNRCIEIVRTAFLGTGNKSMAVPTERHYTAGEVDLTPIRLIANGEATWCINALNPAIREIPIGFINGIAAADLVIPAEAIPL